MRKMTDLFSYSEAFSRNIGWVTEAEQAALRAKTVAIAGMGGVGGVHLLTLARLGISRFHIADFDSFGLVNFNRQAGAMMSTLGQPKVDALKRMALDVNPEIHIETFAHGLFCVLCAPTCVSQVCGIGHCCRHGRPLGHGHRRVELSAGRHEL